MSTSVIHPFDLLRDIDRRSRNRSLSTSADIEKPTGMVGRLALRLNAWRLMFSMDDVSEIIPIPSITRVPGVKPWLMGISNLRGTVISIADLGVFLGSKKTTATTASSRVVIVKSGEWSYGLLVDEVIGMRHFTSENRLSLAETVTDQLRPYVTEVFDSENQTWFTFNVDALLSDAAFLDAAA